MKARSVLILPTIFLSILPSVISQRDTPTNATSLPIGSCTPDIPCSNGACCNGGSGFCGFGKKFCDARVCTSNCDAKAECGPDAPPQNVTCPLDVCCSQFGFCGTTTDFCGEGCLSGCDDVPIPSCGTNQDTALTRRIGYYEAWANSRGCMSYSPEKISAETLTHINFAFALLSGSFKVVEMAHGDADLWKRTTALKKRNPTLKVYLSIGGWTFNDPPNSKIFSNMVASDANTKTFISSVLSVFETYGFDGLDVDWEYPGANDRGGIPADTKNYVTFMEAVKKAFSGPGYGLTFTAPSSYWYLQHFDLPGMLKHADWVNVMTYDLHGTWDGDDHSWIGPIVEAHTNLTEIDEAFKLYWRVGVNPDQMVMGLGFYGRSFTLASPDCSSAGCIWASGAKAGPCSGQSGILMYSEIQSILNQKDDSGDTPSPVFDEDAAVKYVTWDTDQWVSYDDAESFAVKMNYANDRCIGGTMIWAMDQDDDSYTALKGLYPGIDAAAGGDIEKNDKCIITDCGVSSCGDGFNKMGTTPEDPLSPGKRCDRLICCPKNNSPSSCTWRGGDSSPCNPTCAAGEQSLTTQTCESGGSQAFCCASDFKLSSYCTYYECTDPDSATCQQDPPQTLFTTVKKGELDLDSIDFCQDVRKNCPPTCKKDQVKPFCCVTGVPFTNCKWYGSPPLCQGNACPLGQILLTTDIQGDAIKTCSGSNTRSYCCEFNGHDEEPVPFSDIFPDTVPEGSITFQEEFDPDEGVKEGSTGAGTSSSLPNDQEENDTAFGEVFIDSPNSASVSSLDLKTNWVITDCHPTSDKPQSVLMYCSKSSASSECSHVLIGGAEHTIVKMPQNCGRGPYARIASLAPHARQDILSSYHQLKKPADEPVYSLTFDYNFAAIPAANGPIYMRADVTDMPDYWDTVVESPPERKRWLQERSLEERWWGSFKNWLSKMNTVEKDTTVSRNFHWADTWTIFHKEVSCPGPPQFEASIDVSLTGQASLNSRYGFYLQATVVPPAVQAAYLYFSADAKAHGQFTMKGEASVQYDSRSIQFASFGFPGLYYPGLLTVGPSLVLSGYVTGHLSISGEFTSSIGYTFPTVSFNFGKTDPDVTSNPVTPSDFTSGLALTAGYNVELTGSIHVVPSIQLGLSVLGGAVIDAQAFVDVDLYTGVRINGSVSNAIAPKFCIGAYYGVRVDAGLTGNVLYWETGPLALNFYANEQEIYGQCFSSVLEEVTINDRSTDEKRIEFIGGTIPEIQPATFGAAYIEQKNSTHSQKILPRSSASLFDKRGSVPSLPGFLNCPDVDDHIGGDGTDNDPYSDLNLNTLDDAMERRSFEDDDLFQLLAWEDESDSNSTLFERNILVTVSQCPKISFKALAYNNLGRLYFDLANPTAANVDPTFSAHGAAAPGAKATTYGREHIYEIQLISDFMTSLATQSALWKPVNNDFCDWLKKEVVNLGMVQNLLHCFPYNARIIANQNPYMPWLEAVANGLKANTIHGNSLASATTWKKYTFTKMLSIMRSTAGLSSYMNDPEVGESFIAQSNCMKQEWNTWYTSYSATSGVQVTGGINSIYTNFIRGVMSQFSTRLSAGLDTMITFWDNAVKKIDPAKPKPQVAINFGIVVATAKPTVDVSTINLSSLQNFILNHGVTWWSRL